MLLVMHDDSNVLQGFGGKHGRRGFQNFEGQGHVCVITSLMQTTTWVGYRGISHRIELF